MPLADENTPRKAHVLGLEVIVNDAGARKNDSSGGRWADIDKADADWCLVPELQP